MGCIITDEKDYHNEYRVFLNAAKILAQPAKEQCNIMGGYNVAY